MEESFLPRSDTYFTNVTKICSIVFCPDADSFILFIVCVLYPLGFLCFSLFVELQDLLIQEYLYIGYMFCFL